MKKIILLLIYIFFLANHINPETKVWTANTDINGKISIDFSIPDNKAFILQAYIFFQDNWRPIKIFWNKTKIWTDIGENFKNIPYKITLYIDHENNIEQK